MNKTVVRLHDEALGLMPDGAAHDRNLCPICIDQASLEGDGGAGPDSVTEGGRHHDMSTSNSVTQGMTQETHEALVKSAVENATASVNQENAQLKESVATLTKQRDDALAEAEELKTENERINGELDTAQVSLKASQDEASELRTKLAEQEEQARLAEVAKTRGEQVRNLKLFPDKHIDEKAMKWAAMSDEDWAERLEEWKAIKPAQDPGTGGSNGSTDVASAMTGSSEGERTQESLRRQILNLR